VGALVLTSILIIAINQKGKTLTIIFRGLRNEKRQR
jgi:hypothetical protein